jgi:meiotic recombination protein SPO11
LSFSKFHSHPDLPPGLLVTAKGFPDISTRELLSLIHTVPDYRHNLIDPIPMLCLVDGDPYGLNIYGVYKNGGDKGSVIERLRLALPDLKFLGVQFADFGSEQSSPGDGLIALTTRDQRKVEIMLQKAWVRREPEVVYVRQVSN